MTRPLAPALRHVVESRACEHYVCGSDCEFTLAVAQLAALEAVVRAAQRYTQPDGCWGYSMSAKTCRCPLHRALKALDRVTRRST